MRHSKTAIFLELLREQFRRWFHKRNIIIVSERKVKHVPISGSFQFFLVVSIISSISWASYSTGSYMAARSALKEQGQALRSVTSAKIDSNFSTVFKGPTMTVAEDDEFTDTPSAKLAAASNPLVTPGALENSKLAARVALLEHKVIELKNANEAIVQRVHDRAAGRIDNLESIIKQTGLHLPDLKKQAENNADLSKHANNTAKGKSEGGPYIPDDVTGMSGEELALYNQLDELELLTGIVDGLPLSMPIQNSEDQSPFGHRIDPFTGHMAFHSGQDMSGPPGSKIHATADGKITAAGPNGGYGNAVDIDHGLGISTRYGHMSEVLVQVGQIVKRGDVIGIQGSTGRSTGPHVHYEVRYHDQAMNPKNFLEAGHNVSQE